MKSLSCCKQTRKTPQTQTESVSVDVVIGPLSPLSDEDGHSRTMNTASPIISCSFHPWQHKRQCAFNKTPIFIFILSWQFGSEEKDCEVSAVCRRLRTSGGGKKMWSQRFLKISYRLCSQSSGRCQLTFSVSLCLRALQQNTYFKSDTLKNHLMNEFVSWEKYRTNLLPLLNPTDWPVNLFRFVIPEL